MRSEGGINFPGLSSIFDCIPLFHASPSPQPQFLTVAVLQQSTLAWQACQLLPYICVPPLKPEQSKPLQRLLK